MKRVMTNAFLRGPNWRASSLSRRPRTVDVDGVGMSDMEGKNLRTEKRRLKGSSSQYDTALKHCSSHFQNEVIQGLLRVSIGESHD